MGRYIEDFKQSQRKSIHDYMDCTDRCRQLEASTDMVNNEMSLVRHQPTPTSSAHARNRDACMRHIYESDDENEFQYSSPFETELHLLKYQSQIKKHRDDIRVNSNTDKRAVFTSRSEETLIHNDTITHETREKVDKLPVADVNALTYELEHFPRNAMVIFNHENFASGENRRAGTDRDVFALVDTFKRFRFKVTTYDDLERKPLLKELKKFGKQNFEDCGCICIAILTHGSDHGYLRAADVRYSERELFACFDTQENPTLVAKPIIFLIQACRGDHLARSNLVYQSSTPRVVELDAESKEQSAYFLPTEADMIIFHSCFFGRASVRVVGEGTWFIQTICEQLNLYASSEHLEDIFRRVRKVVALEKGSKNAKQMPILSSTLLRKLYLLPQSNLGAEYCINYTKKFIETSYVDDNHGTMREKMYSIAHHALIGIAITVIYFCLLYYSSVVKEHNMFLFMLLLFFFMGRFDVSWTKMLGSLILFFVFLKSIGINVTWEIAYLLANLSR